MASLLVAGLLAVAAASVSKSKPKTNALPPPPRQQPRKQFSQAAPPVYIPEASMDRHPGNLPTHTPVYGDPATDPEMANAYNWQSNAWKDPKTDSFEDSFHEFTQDNSSTIRNRNMPEGLLPHFKSKLQSTLYIEPQTPYEFKPPKSELTFQEMHGTPWVKQNNVHGDGPFYLYDERYAQMSSKSNSALGARDDYSLWDNPDAAKCRTKQQTELDTAEAAYIDDNGDACTTGWFGTKGITKKFEGFHPRARIFPRAESFMSTNPQLYDYAGIADVGPEGSKIGQLGRFEVPSNADVDEYHVEALPNSAPAFREARQGTVVLKDTKRQFTNIPYSNHGMLDLGDNSSMGQEQRTNRNVPGVTKKQLMTNAASTMNFLNYDDTQKLTTRNPLEQVITRRVTPSIRNEIDETLLAPYLSNPFTQPITNMQYPINQSCGVVAATVGLETDLPAYAAC